MGFYPGAIPGVFPGATGVFPGAIPGVFPGALPLPIQIR